MIRNRPWSGNSVAESGYVLEPVIAVMQALIARLPPEEVEALKTLSLELLDDLMTRSGTRNHELTSHRKRITSETLEDIFNPEGP